MDRPGRLFVFGQRAFGAAVFARLLKDGHQVVGCACPPQRQRLDPLQVACLRARVPVLPIDRITAADLPDGIDLVVAAHAHHFVGAKALARARFGGIGFHPSLLPRHRGRDAVRWTVYAGDSVTGGTIYRLTDKVDGGAVLLQRHLLVDRSEDHHTLWRRLFPLGVDLVSEAVHQVLAGQATEAPQDERFATWAPAFEPGLRLFRPELPRLPAGRVNG